MIIFMVISVTIIIILLTIIFKLKKGNKKINNEIKCLTRLYDSTTILLKGEIVKLENNISKINLNNNSVFNEIKTNINKIKIINYTLNNEKLELNEKVNDISINLKKLIDKLNKKNIILNIEDDINKTLIYDNNKLEDALYLILNKSLINDISRIEINVNTLSRSNNRLKVQIELNNINFFDISIEEFNEFLNYNFNTISNDTIKDQDLLEIRLNLLSVSDKILIYNSNNKINMTIELNLEIDNRAKRSDIRALIVEDNISMAKLSKEVLKELKIESDIVHDGLEALKKIINHYDEYNIIFLDNVMPNLSGIELIKKLKQLDYFNIPVVLVTSELGDVPKSIQSLFNKCLNKPLNKEVTKKVLKELVSTYL